MEGVRLKAYLDNKGLNKTALAKALGMSKQNLYQLFSSRQLEDGTKKKIERVLKVSWANIDGVNIDLKEELAQPPEPDHLTRLAEAALLGQKNVERMITMLEEKDRALKDIQASLDMVQPNMLALTAKIQEGQRQVVAELSKKLEQLAAGRSRSSKSLPLAKP